MSVIRIHNYRAKAVQWKRKLADFSKVWICNTTEKIIQCRTIIHTWPHNKLLELIFKQKGTNKFHTIKTKQTHFEGNQLTSGPYVWTIEHSIRNVTSNNMALVCEAFPPSPPICLLHSLNFNSLVTNVRNFPSTAATASISSKLFPVSTWQSTLSSASCNVHTNQMNPPMLQIFTRTLKFCSLFFH